MDPLLLVTVVVSLLAGLLSGAVGGGGGFILTPYWLLIGLTPANVAANGSFMALGVSASTLSAFKNTGHMPTNRRLTITLGIITVICAAVGAWLLPHISTDSFKIAVALLTVLTLPLLFVKRKTSEVQTKHYVLGTIAYTLITLTGSIIFSSAFALMIMIGFSMFFGMTILQGTALRRLLNLLHAGVLFGLLTWQGGLVLDHAIAGLIGSMVGGYIGTRYVIKKGEQFAKYALAVGGLISAVALLFT